MRRVNRWAAVGLIVAAAPLSGCQKHTGVQAEPEHPATVEKIDGSAISRVTLTAHAMKRLDVQTAAVTEEQSPRTSARQKAVPYSALIYDRDGNTWVYTSPQSRVFVREGIDVDYIKGGMAYLLSGPETGTAVATVGVAELYGTEFGVGH